MVRKDWVRNSVLWLCDQPVVIPIVTFATFCQAGVQSMESERQEADVIGYCVVCHGGDLTGAVI